MPGVQVQRREETQWLPPPLNSQAGLAGTARSLRAKRGDTDSHMETRLLGRALLQLLPLPHRVSRAHGEASR